MKDKLPSVAVLMSTYNGEKYIREQLDSLFAQREVDVRLFVRDDGSTDNTIGILEEYSRERPISIWVDGENVRPGESFMRLVYKCADIPDIEYYAFADQDDIWLEDKLIIAITAMRRYAGEEPILYSSNQYLYVDGVIKGDRHKEPQKTGLISHMTKNTIAGCTFVFNKALAQIVSSNDKPDQRILKYRLHDAWLMLFAIACGHVIYDETSHMLYRIHGENTVGVRKVSVKERLNRLERYFVKRDDSNLRMITAQELLRLVPKLPTEKETVLKMYADYQKSWKNKKKLAFNREIRANCAENPNVFTIKVLTNFV